jgi:hypothetical protein
LKVGGASGRSGPLERDLVDPGRWGPMGTYVSQARRRGVEYGPSFDFLMHKENLSLSTSVAHLKRFFSTTKHTNKSFLSKYHTNRYGIL